MPNLVRAAESTVETSFSVGAGPVLDGGEYPLGTYRIGRFRVAWIGLPGAGIADDITVGLSCRTVKLDQPYSWNLIRASRSDRVERLSAS